MYPIQYLDDVKRLARNLGIDYEDLKVSTNPNKKFMILHKGHWTHFGSRGSKDYWIHKYDKNPNANKIRNNYRLRHSKILLKDGSRAIDKKYSPAYLSYYLLW